MGKLKRYNRKFDEKFDKKVGDYFTKEDAKNF